MSSQTTRDFLSGGSTDGSSRGCLSNVDKPDATKCVAAEPEAAGLGAVTFEAADFDFAGPFPFKRGAAEGGWTKGAPIMAEEPGSPQEGQLGPIEREMASQDAFEEESPQQQQ
jgi:hypothetical protein